tara:strand:- start:7 stop:555 length:549 start_codon:yes stop_codon:yes gene_type:complete
MSELTKKSKGLLILDAQERIFNPIKNKEIILKNIKKLINAYEILEENIYFSEQNPKKLGKTFDNLLPKNEYKLFEKMSFSIKNNNSFLNNLSNKKINTLIICGFETHICIQQTVLDFLNSNFEVFLVVDAMGSRKNLDHEVALKRMLKSGAIISTTESIIFELCETSLRKEFRSISNIIKSS